VRGDCAVRSEAVHRDDGAKVHQNRFTHRDLDFIHNIALDDGKFSVNQVHIAVGGRFCDRRGNRRGNCIVNMNCQVDVIEDGFGNEAVFGDNRFDGQGRVKVGGIGSRTGDKDDVILNRAAIACVKGSSWRVGVEEFGEPEGSGA